MPRAGEVRRGPGSRRGLSTAREVLRALAFLEEHPDGVRADEIAEVVGKSTSTAYYLLVSLCEEGFAVHDPGGVYRPSDRANADSLLVEPPLVPTEASSARAVEALFARTRKRSYLGVVRSKVIEITVVRGRQGSHACRAWGPRSATTPMPWPWARWCSRGCRTMRCSATSPAA